MKDYYQILGLKNDASLSDIKKAYRRLAVKFHPDKNANDDGFFNEMFKNISEAYEVLSDPIRKADYDNNYSGTEINDDYDNFSEENIYHSEPEEESELNPYLGWIIGINVVLFIIMGLNSSSFFDRTVYELYDFGGLSNDVFSTGELWRLLTSQFIHADLRHLLFNMYILFSIGSSLLLFINKKEFLTIYLCTGTIAAVVSAIIGDYSVSVGASGAIFGISGFYFALLHRFKKDNVFQDNTEVISGEIKSMSIFLGINLFIGFISSTIDNGAHIGGLVSGGAIGYAYKGNLQSIFQGVSEPSKEKDLIGIKGWLIGFLIHQIYIVGYSILGLISYFSDFGFGLSKNDIRELTSILSVKEILFFEKLQVSFEIFFILEVIFMSVVFILFILKKKVFISLFNARVGISLAVALFFNYYGFYEGEFLIQVFIFSILYLIGYNLYFYKSQRVKNTFIN